MTHYLIRTLLFVLLTVSGTASALTLGQAHLRSFLGEPLNAEIDLIGLAEGQHEDLRLRMANDRHFERLGIAYTQLLTALTFDVAQSDGRWIVRARSTRPVTEPFVDFPLQMTWPGGQLIKQYTLLLDPPRRINTSRVTRARQPKPATAPVRVPVTAGSSSYGPVKSGETLWPIAQKLKPRGITTRQMAMALLRANPQAFIDGNINRLRAGATLEIPQRSFIEQLDAAAARAEFTAQTRQWQAPVATSPRVVEAPVSRVQAPRPSAGPETEKGIGDPPADQVSQEQEPSEAQLRILTEQREKDEQGKPVGSQQDLQKQLLVTMEEIESNRITTDAIESRLARMEAELDRMQKLVELKDAQIAALQADASARAAIQAAAQAAEPPPPPPVTVSKTTAKTSTPDTPPEKTPISITQIEPLPTDATRPAPRPWYEEYLWAIWVVLGLMGLAALLMLIRRPQPATAEAVLPGLPEVGSTRQPMSFAAADRKAETEEPSENLRQAEEDFRQLAEQQLAETAKLEAEEELPELDLSVDEEVDEAIEDGITESLLNEVLEADDQTADRPATVVKESDFSDDDISSWVAELSAEAEQTETQSANDEQIPRDDDIPSILTELDDQLSPEKPSSARTPPPIQLEPVSDPVGEPTEDDTFSMSLDLARAYLEIGDQEGASDMLKQALGSARDPDHRRQIEELLAQID